MRSCVGSPGKGGPIDDRRSLNERCSSYEHCSTLDRMPPSIPDAPGSAGLPAAPQRGRRRPPPTRRTALSLDAVVRAAVEVLDESGVGALSMRAVAQRLGTG